MTSLSKWSLTCVAAFLAGYGVRRWGALRREPAGPREPSSRRIGGDEKGGGHAALSGDGRGRPSGQISRRRPHGKELSERRSQADPEALTASGSDRIGFDLDRLQERAAKYQPLVEHLTFLQVKRGEQRSLFFVRRRDLDTLAQLTGMSKDDFVERFQHLGVMISNN